MKATKSSRAPQPKPNPKPNPKPKSVAPKSTGLLCYWVGPDNDVTIHVPAGHTCPLKVLVARHIDGAISLQPSDEFAVKVTETDRFSVERAPLQYRLDEKCTWTEVEDSTGRAVAFPNL